MCLLRGRLEFVACGDTAIMHYAFCIILSIYLLLYLYLYLYLYLILYLILFLA